MSPSRRDILRLTGGVVLASIGGGVLTACSRRRADLVIRGGTVVDGTGAAGFEADVVVNAGRISRVAPRASEVGDDEIDARGMIVAPGFIDIHSHADGSLWDDPRMESVIRQGITTVVVGADGSSRAPSSGDRFNTFSEYFAAVDEAKPSVNVASMIGLGSVRSRVVGPDDRPATEEELRQMVALVEQALRDGACGASTGLEYTPGAFASLEELIELSRPLVSYRLPYASHMRNEDDRLLEAIGEAIAVAEGAGCSLQISHLKTQGPRNWASLDDAFALVEGANARGVDAAFDRYPYIAYQTGLTNLFPVSSRDGGTARFLERLDHPTQSRAIRAAVLDKVALIGGWGNVQIARVRNEDDKVAEGQRMDAYAQSVSRDPYVATVELLKRNGGSVGMLGFAMSEENLDRILAHPKGMVCSDGGAFAVEGPARSGQPHPRGLGSFPRVLARYVRERGALTLESAVHKMSAYPASRVRLGDRGRLAEGLAADVVVFDADTVADQATFDDPFAYPTGISTVVVNGSVAVRDGEHTVGIPGAGKAVRPSD
ncbi:MAG TPA: D-aminoacylase [Gemmatimonadales bacterium]|nr:D-aminoacylase [Gemmatimonadales bacterium]